MSFDELSSTSDSVSNMSFVYSDALTHQIQNILQGRTNNIIKNYFLYYSYKERCDVKTIVIDMNSGYKFLLGNFSLTRKSLSIDSILFN